MSRDVGEVEFVQEFVPEWLAVLLGLVTQLADVWFLAVLFGALYWFRPSHRDDIAALAGVWLAGIGAYVSLKEFFAFPRPNHPPVSPDQLPWLVEPLYEATGLAGGYGFPSGHAVNATIVYVGLAYLLPVSTPRRRFAGAAAIVTVVCFTRIALGVHYLVDVVAGFAMGILLLLGAGALVTRRPADRVPIAFGLAIVSGTILLVTTSVTQQAVLLLIASLGSVVGWRFTRR